MQSIEIHKRVGAFAVALETVNKCLSDAICAMARGRLDGDSRAASLIHSGSDILENFRHSAGVRSYLILKSSFQLIHWLWYSYFNLYEVCFLVFSWSNYDPMLLSVRLRCKGSDESTLVGTANICFFSCSIHGLRIQYALAWYSLHLAIRPCTIMWYKVGTNLVPHIYMYLI